MQSYYDQIKESLELFIRTGNIVTDVIRPELADSRVKLSQRNILDYTPQVLTCEEIEIKHEKNMNLIEKSLNFIKDINEVFSGISETYAASLFDAEGDIIDLLWNENSKIIG